MSLRRCVLMTLATTTAAACGGGGGDVVYLNPGDGMPVESFEGMDVVDWNDDGLIDIVAASHYFDGRNSTEERLNVFLQDPARPGTFLPRSRTTHQEGSGVWQVTAADLTLDGIPELLIAAAEIGGFALFQQDPADPGKLLAAKRFGQATPLHVDSFSVGDIDGDLYADIVATAGQEVFLFQQDSMSPGIFGPAVRAGEGTGPIVIADVDGDGLNDLVTFADHLNGDGLQISDGWRLHRHDPSSPGSFAAPTEFFFGSVGWAIGTADLDGDDRMDVAINSSLGGSEFLDIYLQTAFGEFVRLPPVATSLDGLLGEQAIADLDGDGRPEIIAAMNTAALDPQLIQIYRQDSGGMFEPDTLLTLPYPDVGQPFLYAVCVADMNADGQPDIVVSTDEIFVFFQRSGSPGTFLPATRIAAQR